MFLSRVQLNPARRAAQPLLASPHVLHAAVMASFPDASPTTDGRVLWRLDVDGHVANVYIVSPREPDLTALTEQGGWPSLRDTRVTRPYTPLLSRVEPGQRYGFRLTANPTHSAPGGSGRGKVFGHVTVAQQERWLLAKQEHCGFRVRGLGVRPVDAQASGAPVVRERLDLVVTKRRTVSFSRRETRVTLSIATFDGSLEVADSELFVRALSRGIGRAKGYGCGLMTIAPVR